MHLLRDRGRANNRFVAAPAHPFDLSGRCALVTGSSAGLGLALAQALGDAGARVIVNGRDRERLESARARLAAGGLDVIASAFDAAEATAASAAIAMAEQQHGPIDILVNNAGVNRRGALDTYSDEDWAAILATNLEAPFRITRQILPGMKARRRGAIVNVCSIASTLGRPGIVPYAITKGGLAQLTRALAVEVAPFGVRVNGIAPGFVATAMNAPLKADAEFDAWVCRRTPVGRWAEPSEIAAAAVFLAADAASYVTGHVLYVDGGFTAAY